MLILKSLVNLRQFIKYFILLENLLICWVDSKTILVTGAGGYIGSHTIVELLNTNYSVVALDNLSNCYAYNETEIPESLKRVRSLTKKEFIWNKVDIRDKDALNDIFKKHTIDAVIHFAALKSVTESIQYPMDYYDNNVAGSNNLFQVMQMNNVKSLIYSSSATVYGNPLFLPFTENHPTGRNISNPYGRTKYFTEELSKDISNTDPKWKIISLRYFNPTGAHPSGIIGEDPKGIPNNLMPYISQVAVGKLHVLNIYGSNYSTPDGTCIRDFIHITDLAKGHLKALHKIFNSEFEGWKAYNLGTGRGYSVLELVKAFEHASGRKVNYKFTSRRYGDIPISYADARLAENDLDWTAEKDIFEMCRDTWKWQSLNPNGYEIDEI